MTAVLYRCFDASGAVLYVGVTSQPWQRIAAHRSTSPFGSQIHRVDLCWFDSRAEALAAELAAIAEHRPIHNQADNPDIPNVRRRPRQRKAPVKTDLAQWIKEQRPKTATQCLKELGVSRSYLYALLDGSRMPSLPLAQRIQQTTDGAVPVSSWPHIDAILQTAMAAE
jgi:predicted GIY-YIG superfamily endonuclease